MAQVYSVPTANTFGALDNDSSDEEITIAPPRAKKTATTENRSERTQTSTSRSSPLKGFSDDATRRGRGRLERGGRGARIGGEEERRGGGGGARGGRGGFNRFGGAERISEEEIEDGGSRPRRGRSDFSKSDRGTNFRGRQYDRHVPGTNRSRGMKKGGGGAHNWGNTDADFGGSTDFDAQKKETAGWDAQAGGGWDDEGTNPSEKKEEKPWGDDTTDAVDGMKEEEAGEAKEAKAPEPELMDYEAYMKLQAAKRANLPTLGETPGRQPNTSQQRKDLEREGYHQHVKEYSADSRKAQMNLAVRYSESDVSDEDSDEDGGVRTKKGMTYNLVDLARGHGGGRGRAGRGGRGGGSQRMGSRGYGDRDNFRGPHPNVALNLGDNQAFPALE